MAQSQVIDWLNENEYRMYPLLEYSNRVSDKGYSLATNVILDLNLYVPGYPLADNIQLLSIVVSGVSVIFNFTGGNSFEISDVTAVTYPYYLPRTGNGSVLVIGAGVKNIPENTHNFSALYVEPAVVFELSNAWLGVSSINVNPEYQTATDGTPAYIAELPLSLQDPTTSFTGDVILFDGFNFSINFDNTEIDLAVLKNYGIPVDCSMEFIPTMSKDCGDIISFVNGIPPDDTGKLTITAGNDILIYDGNSIAGFFSDTITPTVIANPHSLFVGLTFQLSDICSPVAPLPA